MRGYIQFVALICAGAGCSGTDCCNDYTPPTYAVADATILLPNGAPASQRAVTVTSRDPARCADSLPKASTFRASLTTDATGRAVGSMTITPFLMSAVNACVTFAVQGGPLYRDTSVAGLDVRFREAGAPMDTARVTITLTAR
jgi:hypothetical protein